VDDEDPTIEDALRSHLHSIDMPAMPATIPDAVEKLRAARSAPRLQPWRSVVAVLAVCAILAGLMVRLSVPRSGPGSNGLPMISGPAGSLVSERPASIAPAGSAPIHGSVVGAQQWSDAWVPTAVAAHSLDQLVLVGSTGDGIGDAVAAISEDGASHWTTERLTEPPLDGVSSIDHFIWATTTCEENSASGCLGGLIVSSDFGRAWRVIATKGLSDPTFLDPRNGWALGSTDVSTPAVPWMTRDGGATWQPTGGSCPTTAGQAVGVQFVSLVKGWLVCAGDTAAGSEAKAFLSTDDGGRTWQPLAAVSLDGTGVGVMPATGQLLGVSMPPQGPGWMWTDRGLYVGSNGGHAWALTAFGNPDASTPMVSAVQVGEGHGYALVRDGPRSRVELIRTTDGGRTWATITYWRI
jgi:photosystem II stability/assembly factor-like uncharacterized protein